jgi:ABC-type oligopeptide transport system ATPase subunit
MIIGVNGRMGSGKDTVGKIIQYLQCHNTGEITIEDVISNPEHEWWLEEQSNFEIKKFAAKLKTVASLLTGIPVDKFEDQEFKKTNLPDEWCTLQQSGRNKVFLPMTVRELLQKLGTEAMRNGLHTDVWINALFADYNNIDKLIRITEEGLEEWEEGNYPNWIITDMRFPNEMKGIELRQGITIRVTRPDLLSFEAMLHPSETSLDDAKFDYEIINDGTIEDLVEKVRKILTRENII